MMKKTRPRLQRRPVVLIEDEAGIGMRTKRSVRNSLKYRQAEDFALKAQLAKVRLAVAGALKFVRDDQSHK